MEMLHIVQELFSNSIDVNIIIAIATIAIVILYTYLGVPKNLPPGPLGLPIVGYLPFIGRNPHEAFNKLSHKYGPVFSLYLGNCLVVVLNNYEAIKEAFVKQGEIFSGRPPLQLTFVEPDTYNIPLADGEIWKVHRRFALNVLRDLGVGKMSIEPQITEEIQFFVKELKKLNGRPTDFSEQLLASVSNNICILIFGKRFEYDDPWFISAKNLIAETVKNSSTVNATNFFPWLWKVPGIEKIANQETLIKSTREFKKSMYSRIVEFKKQYIDGQRDNYINAFIGEQKAQKSKEIKDRMFPDRALEENVRGLMGAGTETTGNTLLWCMLYMARNPEVQKKVQKEIEDVIGTDRAPCWNDRLRTPYTEATIYEVQRMTTLVPTNIPHKNTKECEIFGYTIPKDTFIVSNLWAVHNDNKLWKNPDEFRPERFLSPSGEVQKNEHLIPFSMGKRECLGISLAKMELYLYFASLLQTFTISGPDGVPPSLESRLGITNGPKHFNVKAVIRDTA